MEHTNQHGGDIYGICGKHGLKREELLDFSANINPLGIPPVLREMLVLNIDKLSDYPDPRCNELCDGLSKYLGVDRECIIAGNGASEMIYLLFDVLRPRRVLIPAPCFSEYANAAAVCGTRVSYFELKESDGFRLKVDELLPHITGEIDALLLCNPNNPTSALVSRGDLLKIIDYSSRKNVNVIVDEAFIELTCGGNRNSVSDCLPGFSNLFIIRALTKIMAIPGLRLGYAAGNRRVIEEMWNRKLPWSVNTFACGLGRLLLESTGYLEQTAVWLENEKKRLYKELSLIPQIKVFEPDTNFILIKLLDEKSFKQANNGHPCNSAALKELMLKKGILIRDAGNFKFLDERFIRVAVKDRKSNEMLVEALKSVIAPQACISASPCN